MTPSWLFKTEPEVYSLAQLKIDKTTEWTGVRNPQAQKFLREIKKGDEIFIYHTGGIKDVVGLAICTKAAQSEKEDPKYVQVEIQYKQTFGHPVPLAEFKKNPAFAEFALVRQSRLSVMPVPKPVAQFILNRQKAKPTA